MILKQSELSEKLKVLKSISAAKLGEDLTGVLLKDKMLIANNFKTSIVVPLVECEDNESYIIPSMAIDFIISLPESDVEIIEKNNQLTIKSGKIKSKFSTYEVDSFPQTDTSIPDESKLLIDINAADLERLVKQIAFASAKPNTNKPVHEGLLFDGDGTYLNIVACDGHRIAWNKCENENVFQMVLDKEALNKAFSVADEKIYIYAKDNKSVIIEAGEYRIYSKLHLEGQFIDYTAIFPKTSTTVYTAETHKLLSCFNRLSLCVPDKKKKPAELNYQNDTLDISVSDAMVDIHESVSLKPIASGESIRMGVNIDFMKDALKAVVGENITVCMNSGDNPILIQDDMFKQLVMPMRLKG